MIPTLGTLTLAGAMFVAVLAMISSVFSVRFDSDGALGIARRSVLAFTGLITLGSAFLVYELVTSDFRLNYVVSYTEQALPLGYKLAAFWAGQEGSLLLWTGMIGWMATIAIVSRRSYRGPGEAVTVGMLALICAFFAALMLFAANPFQLVTGRVPADGNGLNPMLQDFAMLAHPPTLFLGYAGFAVPFAVMIGALVQGRTDSQWLADVRRWVLFSWLTLGVGIVIGAWWAYIELGWGGYWGWDPVENASLLPWLTATALLHSMIMQEHRGVFKRWNVSLLATTFLLCIFGTYITRSGVVSSVHTFGESLVGTFFFVFIVLLVIGSLLVIAWRWSILVPAKRLTSLLEREGIVLMANVLLVLMMLVTLVGTMFPVISRNLMSQEITLDKSFYNHIVAPMGLALIGLMALAPALVYGQRAGIRMGKTLIAPGIGGGCVTAIAAVMGLHNIWALIVTMFASVTIIAILINFFRSAWLEKQHSGQGLVPVCVHLLDANHRRWGGFVVHLGMALVLVGFAGSSLFPEETVHQVSPGDSFNAGRYTLKFTGLKEERRENYTAVVAQVSAVLPSGKTIDVSPERQFYDKRPDEPSTQVAIRTNWREDLYLILAGWENRGEQTAIRAIINPLTIWIWIGSGILTIGGLICLSPRLGAAASVAFNNQGKQVNGFTKDLTGQIVSHGSVRAGTNGDSGSNTPRPRQGADEPTGAAMNTDADSTRRARALDRNRPQGIPGEKVRA